MKKFKKFYVEVTSVCNLACSFCPPTERKASFLSVEDFEQRLEQIKPFTDHIYLHVKGEPLLHPKIDQLLDISYEKGLKVNLTSNGTLLPKVKHKLIGKPALRQINISLHSFDGHPGSKDKTGYVQQVLDFIEEASAASELIVSLRLWNLTENNVLNVERERNDEILRMIETAFQLDYRIEDKFVRGGGIKIADRVYLNHEHEFKWPSLQAELVGHRGFCHALRNQAGILVDGTVVPCCLDGEGIINLGNVNDQPFAAILEGERATKLHEGFSRREAVEELCRRCGFRERFD